MGCLIVIGDGARLGFAERDGAGAVGGKRLVVTDVCAFIDTVGANRSQRVVDAGSFRTRSRWIGSIDAADGGGEIGRRLRATIVVDNVLNNDQVSRLIVVGDGTRLGFAECD